MEKDERCKYFYYVLQGSRRVLQGRNECNGGAGTRKKNRINNKHAQWPNIKGAGAERGSDERKVKLVKSVSLDLRSARDMTRIIQASREKTSAAFRLLKSLPQSERVVVE